MRLGSAPSQNVDLVLATNAEWTMVTSKNCTKDSGCARGAYDATQSSSETIDRTNRLSSANIGIDYYFSGYNATDAFYLPNGINMVDA